ncbi:MAG: phosphodiester glycosidase family protein [Streptococcaceae bacterium]|nr:phosphodiester glycosidase family protein [Streptococcaceae bacterium]MCH4178223.1 phosphodiester glycosidase family protein [Streptococcaceae bacterium]
MAKKRRKKHGFPFFSIYSLLITGFTGFVLLDTFVLPKSYQAIASNETASTEKTGTDTSSTSTTSTSSSEAVVTDTSYSDDNIQIQITTEEADGTTYYVADIQVSDPSYLQTALANDTYGRNIKETVSEMASDKSAILAINGDYYGFRDTGYVVRNGVLYRDTAEADTDALVIDSDGNFSVVNQSDVTAESLLEDGATQVFSFGPTLVEDGEITVSTSDEVGQSMSSNPRTAIGQISENHYIIVVSDGRTDESEGFSLYQLAQVMQSKGATIAYNLDGGGSSTMVFNGTVVNNPVAGAQGSSGSERSVSDMIYIGY